MFCFYLGVLRLPVRNC